MKIALMALGLLAAGVVGGVTSDLLRPDAPPSVAAGNTDQLKAEFSDLRTTVARLTEEVRALRDARVVPSEPTALAGGPAALGPDTEAPVAAATTEELEAKVNKLIEEKDKKDSEARSQRMNAMWEGRDKARLKRLQDELDLTDYQAEELAKILGERRKLMSEMRTKMFEGGRENLSQEQITEFREKMQKSREESDEKVKTLLSSTQYESYEKMDTGGRGMGGFGGGRGR